MYNKLGGLDFIDSSIILVKKSIMTNMDCQYELIPFHNCFRHTVRVFNDKYIMAVTLCECHILCFR